MRGEDHHNLSAASRRVTCLQLSGVSVVFVDGFVITLKEYESPNATVTHESGKKMLRAVCVIVAAVKATSIGPQHGALLIALNLHQVCQRISLEISKTYPLCCLRRVTRGRDGSGVLCECAATSLVASRPPPAYSKDPHTSSRRNI